MMVANKESHPVVLYKGVTWKNTHDNSEKWLKSIYDVEDKEKDNK